MDRLDPTNFDSLEHERRTTVRGLEIKHFPNGGNPWAPGHDFRLEVPVGTNTVATVTANAKELRRWSMILAEAAVRHNPQTTCPECARDVEVHVQDLRDRYVGDHGLDETCPGSGLEAPADTCPACRGDVHVDLSGALWPTDRTEAGK